MSEIESQIETIRQAMREATTCIEWLRAENERLRRENEELRKGVQAFRQQPALGEILREWETRE